MVSSAPKSRAIAVFVPTPSVDDTRIGSRMPAGSPTSAPNPPSR